MRLLLKENNMYIYNVCSIYDHSNEQIHAAKYLVYFTATPAA